MEPVFLMQLALILIATKLFGLLSRRMRLPQVVGALLAGILLGPAVLGIVKPGDVIGTLAELGVILLMFTAGLETDFRQLRGSLKASLIIAVIGVAVPLFGGFALASAFGQPTLMSVFIGVILTATSVSITVETLNEMGKLQTKTGTAILGAAVIDDILGIVILSVMIALGDGDASFGVISLTLLKILAFFACALACGFGIYKLFELLRKRYGEKRRLSIFALAFCFALAFLAERFGVADITGAYIAGLVLCNSRAEKYIEEKNTILSYMFFSPIFFVSVGLQTAFSGFSTSTVLFAVLLLLIAVLSKLIGCGLGARLSRFSPAESLQVGVGMISRGEVALIVAAKGISAGLMDPQFFSAVIIVVIMTTLLTPLLLKWVYETETSQEKNSGEP